MKPQNLKLPEALGLLLCMALSQFACADALQRLYVDGAVGWDYSESIPLDSSDAVIDFDSGVYDYSASLGMRVRDNWRFELGYQSFRNTPEILYGSEAGLEFDSDELDYLKTKSLMFSVLRDFRLGQALRPYFGVGAGQSSVDLRFSEASVNGLFVQRPRRDIVHDKDTAFAFQLLAGVTVPVTPWLDLAADYRYLKVPSVKINESDGSALMFGHGVQSAWLRVRMHAPNTALSAAGGRGEVDPLSGPYVAIRGGGGFSQDMGIEDQITIDAFDPGPTLALAVGYSFRDRIRVELEGSYRRNRVEVIELGPDIGEDAASGEVVAYSLMANGYYLFRPASLIRPFVGGGAGMVRANFDIEVFGFCANLVCGPERRETFLDASDTRAAFQVMAGVEIAINRRLKFTADYRYLNSLQMAATRPNQDVFRGKLRNTSVVVGLRFTP